MLKHDILEFYLAETRQRNRPSRNRLKRGIENVFKVVQRDFRLTINVDDVTHFLKRTKYEERVDPQRKKLAHRDLSRENQVEHQSQNRGAQRIHRCSLNEAQAAQILHLLQLKTEDLSCRTIQALDFLLRQAEAFHEFNISQRLRSRTGQRRGLRNDHLLNLFDFA